MKTLLIEPFGGLAGDMLLAALLDLDQAAFSKRDLDELAERLVPGEARLTVREVMRGAFRGRQLDLETPETERAPHRHLSDLAELLRDAHLAPRLIERSLAVLTCIAKAEAEVHGTSVESVHFHEVGAVDTLIDVVGAVSALELLGVERVLARPPFVGGGTILGAHGVMPVPAPGTAAILRGIPHRLGQGGERLTPTGAALLAVLVDEFVEDQGLVFQAQAIGHGAGSRDPDQGPPNLVRVQWGEAREQDRSEAGLRQGSKAPVWLLEVNLDDTTPEEVGFFLGQLRAEGALEAWSQAVQMKKDRPGVLVSALARDGVKGALEKTCFEHTPTLGVRWSLRHRTELARETLTVDLGRSLGLAEAAVRIVHRLWARDEGLTAAPRSGDPRARGPASSLDLSPEFDDLASLAEATRRPLRELEALAVEAARKILLQGSKEGPVGSD